MTKEEEAWKSLAKSYKMHIKLERGYSDNTVESYMHDIHKLEGFVTERYGEGPKGVTTEMVEEFLLDLFEHNAERSTQGRTLSGINSFFNYLLLIDAIEKSPTELIEHPKAVQTLPDTLSTEEIDSILDAIDLSAPLGHRNRAIIETLYSCGLRVSELVSLRLSDLFFGEDEGFVRVIGKGDKQRLVPVSDECKEQIMLYMEDRAGVKPNEKSADIVFLNRRGGKLSRMMIFNIIRNAVELAGIDKNVSPHTFRHSFATHLLQGGASIRQVQELLGHESITTTEIYTHLDTEHLRSALDSHHPLGKESKE